jgi:hypothetical protein
MTHRESKGSGVHSFVPLQDIVNDQFDDVAIDDADAQVQAVLSSWYTRLGKQQSHTSSSSSNSGASLDVTSGAASQRAVLFTGGGQVCNSHIVLGRSGTTTL